MNKSEKRGLLLFLERGLFVLCLLLISFPGTLRFMGNYSIWVGIALGVAMFFIHALKSGLKDSDEEDA